MIESKQGDRRVQALLNDLELKYEIDNDGDFKVAFELEGGRSQVAFIRSETESLGKFEIREIFSVGYTSEGPLNADIANALLIYNAHVKLGSWQVARQHDDTCIAIFSAQIAANTDAKSIFTTLVAVIQTADEVEAKLTNGEDKF